MDGDRNFSLASGLGWLVGMVLFTLRSIFAHLHDIKGEQAATRQKVDEIHRKVGAGEGENEKNQGKGAGA